MEEYDKFPFIMNQLERMIDLYESDFGEHDIQAILYMKKKAELGHRWSKDVSQLIQILKDKFYTKTTDDEAIKVVTNLLLERSIQAENILNYYRKENQRNTELKLNHVEMIEQLKSTRNYIESCFKSGFEINQKEVIQVLDRVIESGDR